MKHLIIIIILFLTPLLSFSQTVKTTTGNWNDASKWSGSNIGDVVTETVSLSQNTTSTILNGETYTINNLTMNQNDKLYVNTGGTLNVGDATHAASFTTDQNNELYIDGTFTVWGAVNIPQNITIVINGTFNVKGDFNLAQNANITINTGGKLNINGNFVAAQNTNVNITGTGQALINGNITVDHGSNLNTPLAGFQYGGTCTDGGNNFCKNAMHNSALPIKLLYFSAAYEETLVHLKWATASELNFDHFEIEISLTGKDWSKIGSIQGHGTTNELHNYDFYYEKIVGRNYFRLKQVDFDNYIEYSPIISLSNNDDKKISFYPNPVSIGETLHVVKNFATSNDAFQIFNQYGSLVEVKKAEDFTIELTPGVYFFKYDNEIQTINKVVVKAQ